jgi:hypothetical protein
LSKVIPSSVAEVRRGNSDVLVEYAGLDCVLYKVTDRSKDYLGDGGTRTYDDGTETYVQIVWTPEIRLLKSLGMYTEEKAPLPILAYFKYADDPQPHDYIELEYDYAAGGAKTNRFEVADRRVMGHGEETVDVWLLAPLRKVPA